VKSRRRSRRGKQWQGSGLEALENRQLLTSIAEFSLLAATNPLDITSGADGALWFTQQGSDEIGRMTTSGVVTEFPLTAGSQPNGITLGSDNNLWFTELGTNQIGRITTSGVVTEFPLAAGSSPYEITAGPDGNLWFTEFGRHRIGEITTAGVLTEFCLAAGNQPYGITTGPDGALWFTEQNTDQVGRITTLGSITQFSLAAGSAPFGIATGSDGNLWITEPGHDDIAQLTTSGVVTTFGLAVGSNPHGIVSSPTGDLYFTENGADRIGQITTSGSITAEYPTPTSESGPNGITIGPDNHVWFAESTASQIGRLNMDTTTAIGAAPDPSVFGQSVTLTAYVNPVVPSSGTETGTVSFFDGETLLGTGTVDGSGIATFTTSTLAVGSHPLTAVYGGDTAFNGSTTPVNTITVNQAATTTSLTAAPDPSVFGQSSTLTATVSAVAPGSGNASGTVSFFDGATLLGFGDINGSGVATFTTSSLAVGSHSLTAVYGGNSGYTGSTSPVDTKTVGQAATTTVLTAAPDPSVFGQSATLTATVSAVAPGSGNASGTVSFFDGATLLGTGTVNVEGVATFTTSTLAVGSHSLTAVYGGNSGFTGSTSSVDTKTVNQASTTTSLNAAPDPSVYGQSKTLTATVTALAPGDGTATGTVSFYDGGGLIGTGTLSGGVATFTTSSLAVGSHSLAAVYNGDANFHANESSLDTATVTQAATTTSLVAAPDPSVFGQSATLTATVSAVAPGSGNASGTVSFFDGATLLGTGTVNVEGVATFTTSTLAVGSHSLTAVYGGNGGYAGSTSPVDTGTVNQASTTTSLNAAPDPSVFGQSATLTATVSAVAPGSGIETGTVSFFDGATLLGTGPVSGGAATFTTSAFSVGSHSLTAVYGGDSGFTGSTSPVDTEAVNRAATTTALVATPNPSAFGQAATLTATITAVAPGSGTASGTVRFFDGETLLGAGTVNESGVATFTTSVLGVGLHSLRAVYGSDINFNGSTSPVDSETVNQASTVTTLTAAPDPSAFGQSATLTATITAVAPGSGIETGTVSFFDGATLLGTGTVSGGVASFTTSTLAVGSHSLTAVYGGNRGFTGSTSLVDTKTVTQAATTTSLVAAPDPSVFGQSATLTATVSAVAPGSGNASGTVSFFDGATLLGTGTINVEGVATFTTSTLAVGSHSLTAVYGGNIDFNSSTSPVDTKTVNQASTTTSLTAAPIPSVFGQLATLTATVTVVPPGSGTETGTVSFFDGASLLGTAAVNGSGIAALTTSTLALGAHALTAVYGGDSGFNGSTSPLDTETITASTLVIAAQPPTDVLVRTGFNVVVEAADTLGHIDTSYNGPVQIALASGMGLLGGISTVNAVNGVAIFSNLTISAVGSDFTLVASSGELTSVTTTAINVIPTQASLNGTVFLDLNDNGTLTAGERGLGGRTVFIDTHDDGVLHADDPQTITNAFGFYSFTVVTPSTYKVELVTYPGDTATSPKSTTISLGQFTTSTTANFGLQPGSSVLPLTPSAVPYAGATTATQASIEALYHNILGRNGEPAGMTNWENELAAGQTITQIAEQFYQTTEYETDVVKSYYKSFLGRTGSPIEIASWVGKLAAGEGEDVVADQFLTSPEYNADHADNASYINSLYQKVLGRDATHAEVASWTQLMSSGTTRSSFAAQVVDSTEAYLREIDADYNIILGRVGDSNGINQWVTELQQGKMTLNQVSASFFGSPEATRQAANSIT
jgi:streptogramin lyase